MGYRHDDMVVEPTGEDQFLSLRVAGHDLSVIAPGNLEIKAGDRIKLRPEVENILMFGPTTGSRLV